MPDELLRTAIMLSDELHNAEQNGVDLPAYVNEAWLHLSVAIENARSSGRSSRSETLEEAAKDCEAHVAAYRPDEYDTGTLRARREAMATALHRQAARLRALGSAAQTNVAPLAASSDPNLKVNWTEADIARLDKALIDMGIQNAAPTEAAQMKDKQ